jgi:hypothetical protein
VKEDASDVDLAAWERILKEGRLAMYERFADRARNVMKHRSKPALMASMSLPRRA